MAMLLRRVWETMSSRTCSTGDSSARPSCTTESSSLGAFDQIPWDVLIQIVKLIGPKEAAKLCVVSRSWRALVSDNRLWIFFLQHQQEPWDSIFFGETTLGSGYPYQTLVTGLSFMHIYGQRAQVPGSVIIDGEYFEISCQFLFFIAVRWVVQVIASLVGASMIVLLGEQQHFWMQVKPSTQPIVVSIPICHYDDTENAKASRRQLKDCFQQVLFDLNVPAVCAINQATLALYAAKRTSGIVVNIGFQVTSVVPILHGKVMRKVGVEVMGLGALKLTGYLRLLMQQNNINFGSLYTVRTLKEKLCYVAADYKAELSKDTQASLEIAGEGWFTLSKERFQTGEILFQPRMADVRTMGLDQAVALCMDHCHYAELSGDDAWFKTVILTGGSACLPGLAERLEKELRGLLPSSISNGIRVIPPPYGADTAWFGAKLVGNLSTFPGAWCATKKQFRRKSRFNIMWRSSLPYLEDDAH
ncbi:actin-related protein 8 [Citrus sinensis]|uniref:Actin-related protein 8 n=1 Tax=Citrus sinensis TaxID=2711 RepID=A0ACB8P4N7_CITSI|nr:actin-related protein 8 [Citrus sinensis]